MSLWNTWTSIPDTKKVLEHVVKVHGPAWQTHKHHHIVLAMRLLNSTVRMDVDHRQVWIMGVWGSGGATINVLWYCCLLLCFYVELLLGINKQQPLRLLTKVLFLCLLKLLPNPLRSARSQEDINVVADCVGSSPGRDCISCKRKISKMSI